MVEPLLFPTVEAFDLWREKGNDLPPPWRDVRVSSCDPKPREAGTCERMWMNFKKLVVREVPVKLGPSQQALKDGRWDILYEYFGVGILDFAQVQDKIGDLRKAALLQQRATGSLSDEMRALIISRLMNTAVVAQADDEKFDEPLAVAQHVQASVVDDDEDCEFFDASDEELPALEDQSENGDEEDNSFELVGAVVQPEAEMVLPEEECFMDALPDNESSGVTLDQFDFSPHFPPKAVDVNIRSGSIPCRKELGEILGYSVGKGRLWLSHAEKARILASNKDCGMWLPFVHPSVDFTGPWDKWRDASVAQMMDDQNAEVDVVVPEVRIVIDEVLTFRDMKEQVLANLHQTACVITSSRDQASLSTVSGSVWKCVYLRDMLRGKGPFAHMLGSYGVLPGGLRFDVRWNVAPTNGVGMAIVYFENGLKDSRTVDLAALSCNPHRVWNPACEDAVSFTFQPLSCSQNWHPSFLAGSEAAIVLVQISSWHAAPTVSPRYSWILSYSPKVDVEPVVAPMALPSALPYRQYIGSLEFKSTDVSPLRRVELNLGAPNISNRYGYGLWQSLLSLYRYHHADIMVEVCRTSSPLTSVTFAMALLPGARAASLNPAFLMAIPHVEFTFGLKESCKVIKLPSHLLGYDTLCDPMDLTTGSTSISAQTLAVWVLDNPSNATSDSVFVHLCVCGIQNLVVRDVCAGNLPDSSRSSAMYLGRVPAVFWNGDVASVDVPTLGYQNPSISLAQAMQVWNLAAVWVADRKSDPIVPAGGNIDNSVAFCIDAFRPHIVDLKQPTKAFVVFSPVVRILHSCAWFKGTLHYRVVWSGLGTIKHADWLGEIRVSVHGTSILSLRQFHFASSDKAGSVEFDVCVSGPVYGFLCMDAFIVNSKEPSCIFIELVGREQFRYCEVYVMFDTDCMLAGSGSYVMQPRISAAHRNYSFSAGVFDSG